MNNIFKIKVKFVIIGKWQDFAATTQAVGFSPTGVQFSEDVKVKSYAADSWSYSTGYRKLFDTSDLLVEVKEKLEGRVEEISDYLANNNLEALFLLFIKSSTNILPALIIPREFVVFAAKLPAEIDFDIYANLGSYIE